MYELGTWFTYSTPKWEQQLELTNDVVIEKTGLTREQLYQVLKVCHEHEIIK